jgi:RNA polymerase sigma factor (sigma-70 family)
MMENAQDEELISQFAQPAHKEHAFTAIVKKYQQRLYWHIRRMVIEHEDANDVLQNVFIKAWKGLENFRADSSLYTWLYRIGTNESLTFLEKQKRNAAVTINGEKISDLTESIKGEENFDGQKAEWKLQLALQTLPDKQRQVFNLRYYDEMPYAEMSKVLDTSEGALKASYHIAAKKIEEYILNN